MPQSAENRSDFSRRGLRISYRCTIFCRVEKSCSPYLLQDRQLIPKTERSFYFRNREGHDFSRAALGYNQCGFEPLKCAVKRIRLMSPPGTYFVTFTTWQRRGIFFVEPYVRLFLDTLYGYRRRERF